jgi:RimJ/RimL family protein N-acetyltransferase
MEDSTRLARYWPFFGLVVQTPRLELRYPTDQELIDVAELTDAVHDPAFQPFDVAWAMRPAGERERGAFQFNWRNRGSVTPQAWTLDLVCVVDGSIVGVQGIRSSDFAITRTFETGSWIHLPRQGAGIGTEMRQAILHLGFAGLGADRAETGTLDGNPPSRRVTEKCGYRPDGEAVKVVEGERRTVQRYALHRSEWDARRRDDIVIEGLEPCLSVLGL